MFILFSFDSIYVASKTSPVLNNLPDSVSFPEDTSIGTTLFTVSVEDPDVDDVHTFSMTVYPKTSSSTFLLDVNSKSSLASYLTYLNRNINWNTELIWKLLFGFGQYNSKFWISNDNIQPERYFRVCLFVTLTKFL